MFKGSPELFCPSFMRKREEHWGRDWTSGLVRTHMLCSKSSLIQIGLQVFCSGQTSSDFLWSFLVLVRLTAEGMGESLLIIIMIIINK